MLSLADHRSMRYNNGMNHIGYLEVIAGPMYCGKTEELIRQVRRAAIGRKKVQVFKHEIDKRYGLEKKLHSHAGVSFESEVISQADQILEKLDPKTEIVAIDEAQWFGEELVSGLAMTYDRQPFTPIPTLMAIADRVTKLSAVCTICGADAVYHKRIIEKGKDIDPLLTTPALVGSQSSYEARCRRCYKKK